MCTAEKSMPHSLGHANAKFGRPDGHGTGGLPQTDHGPGTGLNVSLPILNATGRRITVPSNRVVPER